MHLVGSVTEIDISAVLDMVMLVVNEDLWKLCALDDVLPLAKNHGPFWISLIQGNPLLLNMRYNANSNPCSAS